MASPEEGALAPEIEIQDKDSNKKGMGTVSGQSTDAGIERGWKAEFPVPEEEAFSNYERDQGLKKTGKDPPGKPKGKRV
jgi:hypothetical protein